MIEQSKDSIQFSSISEPKGINALNPLQALEFPSEQLNLVYGTNGTGKSGYVRIIKQSCKSKWSEVILANVFEQGNPKHGQATIKYKKNGVETSIDWKVNCSIDDLQPVQIFDATISNSYLNDKNEASYEPYILIFFKQLAELINNIKTIIDGYEQGRSKSLLPVIQQEYKATITGNKITALNHKTDVDSLCTPLVWQSDNDKRLQELNGILDTKNTESMKSSLLSKSKQVEKLKLSIKSIIQALSEDKVRRIVRARYDRDNFKKSAGEYAAQAFKNADLNGVGENTWQLMWESARRYSEETAYTEVAFPNTALDAKCVLCQQPLEEDSKERLNAFESFIKSDLESKVRAANASLQELERSLLNVPENFLLAMEGQGLTSKDSQEAILNWDECRNFALENSDVNKPIPEVRNGTLEQLESISSNIARKLEDLKKLENEEQRKVLLQEQLELKSKQWYCQFVPHIKQEHQRLVNLYHLQNAKKTANSSGITRKKNSLAEELLNQKYFDSFRNELHLLGGGKINVSLDAKGSKGKSFYTLSLKGSGQAAGKVLSEGESKLVTLAAFLADSQLHSAKTPFIFDDPITSLDADYEERVVLRLIELSKTRQVIVFTHRLSFLSLLESEGNRAAVSQHIVSLSSHNGAIGNPDLLPLKAAGNKKALNRLKNENIAQARKVLKEFGQDTYLRIAAGICIDFRKEIERIIEKELLSGVVERYRRSINTMGKLEHISLVTENDCKILDDVMTKYSCFAHSQPDEINTQIPSVDEIEGDICKVSNWLDEFQKRKKNKK